MRAYSGLMIWPCICAFLLAACLTLGWRLATSTRLLAAGAMESQELRRLLRLAAADMRAPALNLLGHAAHVPPPLTASLLGLCRDVLFIADALQQQTEAPGSAPTIQLEDVALAPVLHFVVAQVSAQLGPGRRAWRPADALNTVVLRCDRRALHQVLLRVLTSAALATAEGDRIAIEAVTELNQWALVVEDEGTGLAAARIDGAGLETRGLGVGLALAQGLMRAHGGQLRFESTSLVGTRAILEFPRAAVVG